MEVEDFSTLTKIKMVGRGGFATVWTAHWQGNLLAVKIFNKASKAPDIAAEILLLRLRHPCICTMFGMTTIDKRPTIVLEYMAGGSLAAFLFASRTGESEPKQTTRAAGPSLKNLASLLRFSPKGSSPLDSAAEPYVPRPHPAPHLMGARVTSVSSLDLTIGSFAPAALPHGERASRSHDSIRPRSGGTSAREPASAELRPSPVEPLQGTRKDKLLGFGMQLASGLAFLHSNGVYHRDVKTDNALLDAMHTACKLADFGLASLGRGTDRLGVGTLRYMAPELHIAAANGQPSADPAAAARHADVYAFGMLLYEIVHGRRVFAHLSGAQAAFVAGNGERPPIEQPFGPLAPLILRCWAEQPKERPTMVDILRELENAASHYAPLTNPSSNHILPARSRDCSEDTSSRISELSVPDEFMNAEHFTSKISDGQLMPLSINPSPLSIAPSISPEAEPLQQAVYGSGVTPNANQTPSASSASAGNGPG